MLAQVPGHAHKCPLTTGNHPTNTVARKHSLGIVTVCQQVVKAILEKKTTKKKVPELPTTASVTRAHRITTTLVWGRVTFVLP